ncbi:hypothetical protein PAESOLCIP111_00583 [Paenibacillus solanacearum]|uniref:Flagellar hook-length control protein FliK n=1 Tax=Paenibacillus solanacearum TaxID=2048548 RepID=A0A916JUU8_9BACL|nr:hypothetical protein PAESOLCIP111_00583 [Paenibacillus solanacearum]
MPAAGQQGPASTGAPQAAGTGLSQPAPAGSGAAQAQAGGEVPPPGAAAPSAAQGSAGAGAPPPEGAAASAAQAGAKPALATAAPAAAPSGEAAARPDAQPSPSAGSATAPQGAATAADAPAARSGQAPAQPAAAETQAPNAPAGEHVLSRLMKALGVEHEYHSLKQIDRDPAEQAPFPAAAGPDAQKTADTLKSVLLQLSQASDVPTNVKEAAQQAVQQITGQQLLLTQDRTALFSHMTLFVPIIDANGEQTAAVHIQSRKGKNGRLDASNCRLVFDLQMKALGDTMIDVQVVNRIVSLHIHNNLPFVQQLLETNKEEIAQGLASVGYQFISMKCSPYPDKTAARAEGSSTPSGAADSPSAQLASVYGRTPYKGVDIRL